MTEHMRPDEAAQALAHVRATQQQVIDVATIPVWFWWTIGPLMVIFAAAIESGNSTVIGIGVAVFVLGLSVSVFWVVRRALRVQVRNDLLGFRGAGLIVGFVLGTVWVSIAAIFGLQAAGVSHPAIWGNAIAAVTLGFGGPWLGRRLRRIMIKRTESRR
ncbi:MAG: hypothetical protein HOU81_00030 [Hamadaea sp.]|uniref:hypothetical protein n=1 Tax=Hamadaea sp. TaxID=2024425 RepID=UPI0017C95DCF|nr:hypothetical protein [Hamadaea sp.]NUR69204.1 hypothetical protein [Hamadaea sp.]NUT20056.1 hypothetical protein [Hamadaea sp.]